MLNAYDFLELTAGFSSLVVHIVVWKFLDIFCYKAVRASFLFFILSAFKFTLKFIKNTNNCTLFCGYKSQYDFHLEFIKTRLTRVSVRIGFLGR